MTDTDGPLAFETLGDENGLEIVDRIEQERCVCRSEEPVSPTAADGDRFHFPVDHAVEISASKLTLPNVAGTLVRNKAGEIIRKVPQIDVAELPHGSYKLELLTQFKTYLSVTSSVDIYGTGNEVVLDFESETRLVLGARANHERPAATVTTTPDPVDMMAAVETFGSALKTIKPDRSLPSLRGHPPAIELGERLDVPDSIKTPSTGVTLEIPARRDAVYVAAPLAYYLGANLEPGSTPRLVTDEGFEYSLSGADGYERGVERALKQLFLLDCVTRTEGLHKLDLHERAEIERLVDLDFETLYDQSLQKQIEAYLDIPYEIVEEYVPDWRLTTHVQPEPATIEQLPFVVDDLAIVRTRTPARAQTQSSAPTPTGADLDSAFTRSANSQSSTTDVDYVEPQDSDSREQAWIGEDVPVGASKLTREAFENRLDLDPVDGDITITIVLNDQRMDEERNLVDRAYGEREDLPFNVDVHRDVMTDELRELLQQETAFLHYIGHTEEDGFECPDGKLDADSLDHTGIQAFMLNACNSYEQGLSLIQAGAVGGIVTLNDVINDGAVRIGVTVAKLLNVGFPLRSALLLARDESILGGQYIVAGDGGMTVSQSAAGLPNLLKIRKEGGRYYVNIETFATDAQGLGAIFEPFISDNDTFYLGSGETASFAVGKGELEDFLRLQNSPVRFEDELYWSQSIDMKVFE